MHHTFFLLDTLKMICLKQNIRKIFEPNDKTIRICKKQNNAKPSHKTLAYMPNNHDNFGIGTELLSPYNNILLSEAAFRDQQEIEANN